MRSWWHIVHRDGPHEMKGCEASEASLPPAPASMCCLILCQDSRGCSWVLPSHLPFHPCPLLLELSPVAPSLLSDSILLFLQTEKRWEWLSNPLSLHHCRLVCMWRLEDTCPFCELGKAFQPLDRLGPTSTPLVSGPGLSDICTTWLPSQVS